MSYFSEEKHCGVVLGHEASGVVVQLGEEVDPETCGVRVGDKIAAYPWMGCRKCNYCQAGDTNYCPNNVGSFNDLGLGLYIDGFSTGGYASHFLVPEVQFALKVPDQIPMHVATTLMCGGLTAYTALTDIKQGIEFASRHLEKPSLLVLGMGGLGLWCTRLARHALKPYNIKLVCADTQEEKRDLAQKSGADDFVVIDRDLPQDEMVGRLRAAGNAGFEVVIDFVGSPQTCQMSMKSLNRGGIVQIIGLIGGAFPFSIPMAVACGLKIQASRTGTLEATKDLLNLVATNNITYPDMETYKLDDINDIHDRMRKYMIKGRAILDFTQ